MRKHLIALLGFLSGVAVYCIKAPVEKQAAIEEFHQQEFVTTTMAAPKAEPRAPAVIPVATAPADITKEEFEDLPGLPRGMKFAPHVKAVASESWSADMGPKLLVKNGFIFFRSKTSGEANVVYDRRLKTFHPMTATIRISGVSEDERNEILKDWEEYHYNKDVGVQYVQSSHATLLSDYEALKKSGHKADLEVIQAVYQTR